MESEWKTLADKLSIWRRDLTTRATDLDRELTRLTRLEQTWSSTLAQAETAGTPTAQGDQSVSAGVGTPPEILQRILTVIAAIRQTREAIEKRRAQVLTLQNRVADQDARIAAALASVRRVREETD